MQPRKRIGPKEERSGKIRDYKLRYQWQTDINRTGTVWAFYNNGSNLYVDPYNQSTTSYYRNVWQHVPYCLYYQTQRLTSKGGGQHVIFQTLGHDPSRNIHVIFGCNLSQIFSIPPLHILYVSVEGEITVKSHLVQFQPLPGALVPLVFQR